MNSSLISVDVLKRKGMKFILPLFFCIITLLILWLIALPIGFAVSKAADQEGFKALNRPLIYLTVPLISKAVLLT